MANPNLKHLKANHRKETSREVLPFLLRTRVGIRPKLMAKPFLRENLSLYMYPTSSSQHLSYPVSGEPGVLAMKTTFKDACKTLTQDEGTARAGISIVAKAIFTVTDIPLSNGIHTTPLMR